MITKYGIITIGVMILGCSRGGDIDLDSSGRALGVTGIPVIRITAHMRSEDEVEEKLGKLAAILGGSTSATMRLQKNAIVLPGKVSQMRFDVDVGDDNRLKGWHESHDDSFEVFDSTIAPTSAVGSDVSLADATKLFFDTHSQLVSAGLIAPSRIRASDFAVRVIHASEGDQTGARRMWVDEYVFFVPLNIQGIHVGTTASEYGLQVNVHRTNRVRRIAIDGAAVAADEPGTVTILQPVAHATRKTPAEEVARETIGPSETRPLGLRYVVDEDSTESNDLIARELLWVSPLGTGSSGEAVHGKAYVASYAIDDSSDALAFDPKPGTRGPSDGNGVRSK